MFCANCGQPLEGNSKFCPYCGTKLDQTQTPEPQPVAQPAAPAEQPVYAPQAAPAPAPVPAPAPAPAPTPVVSNIPEAPAPAAAPYAAQPIPEAPPAQAPQAPKKKGKAGLLIGIGAAVIVVILAAALLLSGVFTGARATLGKAISKSAEAYGNVHADLGAPDIAALMADEQISQELRLTVNEVAGDSTFDGVGVRINSGMDLPGQQMNLAITPLYDDVEIATVQLGLNGTILYVGSPELTDGELYGVDTAKLGEDIAALIDDDSLETIGFNFYDLMEITKESMDYEAMAEELKAAEEELFKSMEVTKEGREEIKVNGNKVKATKYLVVISADALEDYIDALEASVDPDRMSDALEAIYESMGLPEDILDEVMSEVGTIDTDYIFDELRDAVDELGDLEFDVYISNGYVVFVEYEFDVYDTEFVIELQLGGGKHYVDDLSIVLEVKDEGEIVLSSSGNHHGDGGVFTDKTTVSYKEDGAKKETVFSSEFELSKKDKSFEGEMEIGGEAVLVSYEGTLETDKSSMDIDLSKLKVKSWGEVVFEGSLGYAVGAYEKPDVDTSDVTMILSMSEDDLMEIATELYDNLLVLVEDLDLDLDALDELLSGSGSVDAPAVEDSSDYWYGYDCGYDDGYDEGWAETEYDDSAAFIYYEGDAIDGYLDGYYYGYDDGYWGYDYGESYGLQ